MFLPLVGTALLLLPTLVVALAWALVLGIRRRPVRAFLGRAMWLHAGLLVLHAFVTVPALLGWLGSRWVDTRPDERGYAGPRILADGAWALQNRGTLAARTAVDPEVEAAARARFRACEGAGGVPIAMYKVAARQDPPRAVVVLVHGLFRCAMEVEPVGAMFREYGCEVWLHEMRNHGRSGRAPVSFGLRESEDLVLAVAAMRAQGEMAAAPLLLFGVSLGSAAVALAAPRIPGVAGLVLDSPVEDLLAAAHRMLGVTRNEGRRVVALWEPWRSLTLGWVERWSGFALQDVRPLEALAALPPGLPVLLIGAEQDDRAPPDAVAALFRSLPMEEGRKDLWVVPGAAHGRAFLDRPEEYRRRLQVWLRRVLDG